MEPSKILEFLEKNGWKHFPRKRQDIKVFQKETDKGFFQVIIPLNSNLHDYNDAMADAIKTISIVDGISENELN